MKDVFQVPFLRQEMPAYIDFIQQYIRIHFFGLKLGGFFAPGALDPIIDLKMLPFSVHVSIV